MELLRHRSILVTGGTGFIGKSLCEVLVQAGARLSVLTRSDKHISTDKISYISSLSMLGDAAPDIIINLAGEPIAQRWTAAVKKKLIKSRVETTAALIDYIKSRDRKPSLLISGSAIGYYGTKETGFFEEDSPPDMSGAFFSRQLCAAWEQEAVKAERYGVRTVLLRIGAVLEKDGGMLKKLLIPFRLGLGGPIGHGQQELSWIDRDDLIRLIVHIIMTDTLTGPVNATAPHPVSNKYFSKMLAQVLDRPCLLPMPATVVRVLFGTMAEELMLEGQRVLPLKALHSGFTFSYPLLTSSLQKILKAKRSD